MLQKKVQHISKLERIKRQEIPCVEEREDKMQRSHVYTSGVVLMHTDLLLNAHYAEREMRTTLGLNKIISLFMPFPRARSLTGVQRDTSVLSQQGDKHTSEESAETHTHANTAGGFR